MKIKEIQLNNIKCFVKGKIDLSPGINVFVGKNNSGKSTIARTTLMIQQGYSFDSQARRVGADNGEVKIYYGAGDIVECLATAHVDDLIAMCKPIGLQEPW